MEEATKKPRPLFKDGRYYLTWWLAIVGVLGGVQMVGEGAEPLIAFIDAAIIALVMWLLFTLAQNTMNKGRSKKASWAIGFVVWMGVKFLFAIPRFL